MSGYIITGQSLQDGRALFWSETYGWTSDRHDATEYTGTQHPSDFGVVRTGFVYRRPRIYSYVMLACISFVFAATVTVLASL